MAWETTDRENSVILRIRKITADLERVNREIKALLAKLPLNHYRDVAKIQRLMNEQSRLMSMGGGGRVPRRFMVLYDNARETAVHLRGRYSDAYRKGMLRKVATPSWEPPGK